MKIAKVFNNNIAVAVDDFGHDVVIMGSGVAFQKRFGDVVDESKVERKFRENADDLTRRYRDLVMQVPERYFEVAAHIVDSSRARLGRDLSETLYFTLADHIHFAVQRLAQGIELTNNLLEETAITYPDEFACGREACALISASFGMEMPLDEAAFIALHLVEASLGTSMEKTVEMTRIVACALAVIVDFLGRELPQDSLDAYRLMVHLKLFARRMALAERPTLNLLGAAFVRSLRLSYPSSYRCACRVSRAVRREFGCPVSEEERIYLTIHIERLCQNLREGDDCPHDP